MAQISIAIPVYNGASMLREALDCLRKQSFTDFEAIIIDNQSTDETRAIAQSVVDADPRFRLIVNPTNIGALNNFTAGLRQATAPFFLWRAFDDFSDENYLEVLHSALVENPDKDLATGIICSKRLDETRTRYITHPAMTGSEFGDILRLMFSSHAGWFYGLWRREPLVKIWDEMLEVFPYPWASDHLLMFRFLLARSVALEDGTVFTKYIKRTSADKRDRTRPHAAEMQRYRDEFTTWCRGEINRQFAGRAIMKLALKIALFFYVDKRVYRLRSLWRIRVMELLRR